jgi:serine/threonine protein kinase
MNFDSGQPAYRKLRNIITERTNSVVAWVGAGLSVPAGLPTWEELRDDLVEEYRAKTRAMSEEVRDEAEGVLKVVEHKEDLWEAFKILKENMGRESYRQTVRDSLRVADSTPPPENYRRLWEIGINGLINLNIDRLATRAYVQEREKEPLEYTGDSVKNCIGLLRNPNPFILNLHGDVNDFRSWVFTKDAINWLMETDAYKEFINNILIQRKVIFVGLTLNDISTGSHIKRVSEKFDIGGHFWVTNKKDRESDQWAEDNGLRVIRYESPNGEHSGLDHLFEDLLNYVPEDSTPTPVQPDLQVSGDDAELPPPSDLAGEDPEKIRSLINKKAKLILQEGGNNKYNKYNDFCEKYDRCIYNAWYTSDVPPDNELMDYKLKERVESGAFGVVYRASDSDGNIYAIKKLKEEIRKKDEFLQGFRRGVNSHKILEESGVGGIIEYYEAYEIPAFVVMEWVNGPTLKEAVKSRYITDWREILSISKSLSSIIRSAHTLPERVLHRDLRPANVMLKNYFEDPSSYSLVVLDFDLSWHKGAIEESIKSGHSYVGYLAPEQINRTSDYSTRSASVDSYGIGMTMYYLLARTDPSPMVHKHSDWQERLLDFASDRSCSKWKSAPKRFARLIYNCTKQEQPARWDMTQIHNEIGRLEDAVSRNDNSIQSELVAEEIAERCGGFSYNWNADEMRAEISIPSGMSIHFDPNEVEDEIEISVRWHSSGKEETKNIGKYVGDAANQIVSKLESIGWEVVTYSPEPMSFALRLSNDTNDILKHLDRNVEKLRECISIVDF